MATTSAIIRFDPNDVHVRLAALGLNEEALLHTAQRWHLSWSSFTPNHPPIGIGISAWTEAVAALREQLLPKGWTRSDEKNYALVVHPDGTMAINVATGDVGTGLVDANPSNKAPKGVSTADAISVNQQQLETCWTTGARPSIGAMFVLQSEGQQLIQQGIRPEFLWVDPSGA